MYVTRRVGKILRGLIYKYGAESFKKRVWNWDYSHNRYGYGNSAGDFLYPFLVEHAHNGSILDLGCGEGKTANELSLEAYTKLVGVDISDVAVAKARLWSERSGRGEKNLFYCSDLENFVPSQQFDGILFRDSLYYLTQAKIMRTLDRYSGFLSERGCFVVRLCEGLGRHAPIVETIEANFRVIGKRLSEEGAIAMAFRPRGRA